MTRTREENAADLAYDDLSKIGLLAYKYHAKIEICQDPEAALDFLGNILNLNIADLRLYDEARADRADRDNVVYVVEGAVTDPESYDYEVPIGTPEWQFSDGPAGARGSSADYIDLMQGLREHAGKKLVFEFSKPEWPVYEVTLWEKVTYTAEVPADSEEEAMGIVEDMVLEGEIDGVSQGYSARIVNERMEGGPS